MPLVDVVDQDHAQKEENDGVTCGTQHFDEVLDGRVGLVRNIRKGVMGLDKAATNAAFFDRWKVEVSCSLSKQSINE